FRGLEIFRVDVSGAGDHCGKSPELAQIYRTRRPNRRNRKQFHPKHFAEKLVRTRLCPHFAPGALPWCAPSKCRSAASSAASVYIRTYSENAGRRGPVHELSAGADWFELA